MRLSRLLLPTVVLACVSWAVPAEAAAPEPARDPVVLRPDRFVDSFAVLPGGRFATASSTSTGNQVDRWSKRGRSTQVDKVWYEGDWMDAVSARGQVVSWAESLDYEGLASLVKQQRPGGPVVETDILPLQRRSSDTVYGFRGLDPSCAEQFRQEPWGTRSDIGFGIQATAQTAGAVYAGEADGPGIIRVRDGVADLLLELPEPVVRVTRAQAEDRRWPRCVVGERYFPSCEVADLEVDAARVLHVATSCDQGSPSSNARLWTVDLTDPKLRARPVGGWRPDIAGIAVEPGGATWIHRGKGLVKLVGNRVRDRHRLGRLVFDLEWANGALYYVDRRPNASVVRRWRP